MRGTLGGLVSNMRHASSLMTTARQGVYVGASRHCWTVSHVPVANRKCTLPCLLGETRAPVHSQPISTHPTSLSGATTVATDLSPEPGAPPRPPPCGPDQRVATVGGRHP